MITVILESVLPWLLIAVGTWLAYQIVRQNGRILLRLEAIEKHVTAGAGGRRGAEPREVGGLPLGAVAPEFDLPDLTGVRHKLADYRDKNVLLIFLNPQCGYCTKMATDLAALPTEAADERAVPIVVTTGDAEENRKFVEQYGIRCLVLLQEQTEVAAGYRASGTPMGYRIDRAGRITSELVVGAEPLLKLAIAAASSDSAHHMAKVGPSLIRSRLNRQGLKAGTPAPEFRLPSIDPGELSLTNFRGERVLLVFSDPNCGPCDALARQLQEVHLRQPELQVVVVSRGDVETNRAKATALGLTFPIALQKQWEVSLKYGMFATPIAYLIDEQGILASDVAVGVGPILALAGEGMNESFDDESSPLGTKQVLAI